MTLGFTALFNPRRRPDTPIPELFQVHDLRYSRGGCDNIPYEKTCDYMGMCTGTSNGFRRGCGSNWSGGKQFEDPNRQAANFFGNQPAASFRGQNQQFGRNPAQRHLDRPEKQGQLRHRA